MYDRAGFYICWGCMVFYTLPSMYLVLHPINLGMGLVALFSILGIACGLISYFSPYFYVSFLTILLVDRAFRDDQRCARTYGHYWQQYCEIVPYKIMLFMI
ncbi:MAG: hypothetical protein PSV35_10615 [bacterium]|nr:hypothetical protein [bacterium]